MWCSLEERLTKKKELQQETGETIGMEVNIKCCILVLIHGGFRAILNAYRAYV